MTDEEIKARYQSGNSRKWTGIMLVLVSFLLLGQHAGLPIPHWVFSWQMILIVVGVTSAIQHKFYGIGWLIMIFIGTYFLIADNYPAIHLHDYTLPIILMGVGLIFIFRPKKPRCRNKFEKQYWGGREEWKQAFKEKYSSSEDFLDATSIMGGIKKNILSKDFKGGDIVNFFGGTEIDLSQTDINGRVMLEITQVFGGTKLIVPPHWDVRTELVSLFSGIEDRRPLNAGAVDPTKVLLLKGTSIFGGIDIRSY
jgi:predicted membrane protein